MPDRRQSKSKYTADRNIPGAFEGETVTRRRFMTGTTHAAGAIAASAFALPALGFALGPVFEKTRVRWEPVGTPADFGELNYIPKVITSTPGIGQAGKTTVYMRRRNPSLDTEKHDQYNDFIAISTRCMHLGCPVRYISAAQRFICPCHGGVYGPLGEVSGGPPVRPLDRFYTKVEGGRVLVGARFSLDSHFKRFPHPRDPSNHLDGLWQYLYPSRPTT